MFARKPKSSDVQSSLQRFTDFNRDTSSRSKHFRIIYDNLTDEEKRLFCNEYSFEIFHLVDSVLSNLDLAIDSQGVFEAENALWALEQLLINIPDFIGRGWQKHAIETILKRGLHPGNMFALRKMCIRLFLCWYQALYVYNNTSIRFDGVFQTLLPFFPLRNKRSTITLLTLYCEGNSFKDAPGFNPMPSKITPIIPSTVPLDKINMRDRAQNLQIYLDKFLEYTCREMTKLNWQNMENREKCAGFLFDKVCQLYIDEVFPDLRKSGVDIFEDWDGNEDTSELLDTADPLVIARYWLIRWVTNIASVNIVEDTTPGLIYFKQWLFSSETSVNMLFSLLKRAIFLPLACSSVIQKVIALIKGWLMQVEIPPFMSPAWPGRQLDPNTVQVVLLGFLLLFFRSPYIPICGDRYATVQSLTQTILELVMDITVTQSPHLTFADSFWHKQLSELCAISNICCNKMQVMDSNTIMLFTRCLLTSYVQVYVFRGIDLPPNVWESLQLVFKNNVHPAVIDQWSIFVDVLTYVMVLNTLNVELKTDRLHPIVKKCLYSNNGDSDQPTTFLELNRIVKRGGQSMRWYRCWMRMICLLNSGDSKWEERAEQTLDRCTLALIQSPEAHSLVHWLASLLLASPSPIVIPALASVLIESEPPQLLHYKIIARFRRDLQSPQRAGPVLAYYMNMPAEESAALQLETIKTLQKLVSNVEFSSQAIKVASVLALNNDQATDILRSVLSNTNIQLELESLATIVNALSVKSLEVADPNIIFSIVSTLSKRPDNFVKLFYQLCVNLNDSFNLGFENHFFEALTMAITKAIQTKNSLLANELKWQFVSLLASREVKFPLKSLLANIAAANDDFLEGFLIERSFQFPLPGFSISSWNSVNDNVTKPPSGLDVLLQRPKAMLTFENNEGENLIWSRTLVGKHSFTLKKLGGLPASHTSTQDWLTSLAKSTTTKEVAEEEESHRDSKFFENICGTSSEDDINRMKSSYNTGAGSKEWSALYDYLSSSKRKPIGLESENDPPSEQPPAERSNYKQWRQFVVDMHIIDNVAVPQTEASFLRDLRHLDQTLSREVHKVAVIYVASGQDDKQSILCNNNASPAFNNFVSRLGWLVVINQNHRGYCGGLPPGQVAPYYANANSEVIFHVSTLLTGDATQKMKHLGNDEVHVVWTEHNKTYRRDLLATKFCDVLIVIQPISDVLVRVRVEVQQPDTYFGPLFDGAQVHLNQLPELIKTTVINASCAYRVRQSNIPRPNKHREQVFNDTSSRLHPTFITKSLCSSYIPSLKA